MRSIGINIPYITARNINVSITGRTKHYITIEFSTRYIYVTTGVGCIESIITINSTTVYSNIGISSILNLNAHIRAVIIAIIMSDNATIDSHRTSIVIEQADGRCLGSIYFATIDGNITAIISIVVNSIACTAFAIIIKITFFYCQGSIVSDKVAGITVRISFAIHPRISWIYF